MALPPNFSFIWEDRVAGSGYPGSGGSLAAALTALRDWGITSVLSLTEQSLDHAILREFEFDYLSLPVEDFTAPASQQVDQAMNFINKHVKDGHGVLVHCRAGMGRTGTILACFLVSRGWEPSEAIADVRRKRPGSLEVYPQEFVVYQYAKRLQADTRQPSDE